MEPVVLAIDGMSCGGCVRRVSGVLGALPGVEVETVTVGRAELRIDPTATTEVEVVKAIEAAGYAVRKD